ncbi:MAG: UbiD family decarboxylase, partial [Planctomycetes bacterium]|nr:UbiD family decarboxylase [Planctomycetota bacterium]
MGYRSLQECVVDLEKHGKLVRVSCEVDPHLEIAEIQRRAYLSGSPALLLTRVKGCQFPVLCNLFGTLERTRFLFRDSLEAVRRLIELKIDPNQFFRNPWKYRGIPRTLLTLRIRQCRTGPVVENETTIDQLPQIQSWPEDGGPFITLPQVYTEHPDQPGFQRSNLGMYRVQLAGNQYITNREIGLHYQIHRGIGVHHAAAIRRGERLPVNIFVGGPPALTLSAIMPLPEGLSELLFAGALGRRTLRMIVPARSTNLPSNRAGSAELLLPIHADTDFCISGSIDPTETKPEGPFGDHLGYYSLRHEFPVMKVDRVFHRRDAIWPYTAVGRPPQ